MLSTNFQRTDLLEQIKLVLEKLKIEGSYDFVHHVCSLHFEENISIAILLEGPGIKSKTEREMSEGEVIKTLTLGMLIPNWNNLSSALALLPYYLKRCLNAMTESLPTVLDLGDLPMLRVGSFTYLQSRC